jgi:cobalt/nickel transport system permease protein/cobalt/nickel transport protein
MSRRVGRRAFLIGFLLVALLIAGVGSRYASGDPDGLEFVAEKTRFLDSAKDSAAADSPFADYSTKGIDDVRLSGGVAGIVGSLIVLVLAGGLFWAVRRRGSQQVTDESEKTPSGA